MTSHFRTFGWIVAGLLAACSSSKSAQRADGTGNGPATGDRLEEKIVQQRQANEKVTEFDLNHDKKPDVWEYRVTVKDENGKDVDRLVRKELDINWDGRVDIVRYYNDREEVVKEALDLDFDGKIDQINYYEKGVIVKKERDLDFNGRPDLWIYYEKGHIVRKERDTKGTGKVDYWEYWENDKVDRIGEDLDGDGVVDRWIKNPNSTGDSNG